MKRASSRSASRRSKSEPLSERVEVPGARPATFKLVERAEDSFYLYRSSRKIGTARVEENGDWTARIEAGDLKRTAAAKSGRELLLLVGAYLLTREAREAAARPVEESDPALRVKGRKTPEERLSLEFAERAQASRIAALDQRLQELGRSFRKA
jgi:hypothetical protein